MGEKEREAAVANEESLYSSIADMGSGLLIAKVSLADFKEQDINARIMKSDMQKQLTDNIKKRGQLESLPFCALIDGKIEIVSGHHRIRSAKDSGIMSEIFVILDTTGLRRSQVAAKQLAHNAISGFDDQSTLKEIAKMIDDVDDMIESFVGKDVLGEPMAELEKMFSPEVEFDWKNVAFTFLPHQVKDLEKLIETLSNVGTDFVGVADVKQYEDFIETLTNYKQFSNIKNTGAAVHAMVTAAKEILDGVGYDNESEWVQLTKVFGGSAIPKELALKIKEALDLMIERGEIDKKNKVKALEVWAGNYWGGK